MTIVFNSRIVRILRKLHLFPRRFVAFTLFEWILTDQYFLLDSTVRHEKRHVTQYRYHLYVFYLPAYFLLWLIFGYENHPYEEDARRYE